MCKKIFSFLLLFVILLSVPIDADASNISAASAVVMDGETHTVLYDKNSDKPLPMASTTKIMTALLTIESERLYETVTVGQEVNTVIGSSIYLKVGDKITLYDLVVGMMLASGNDAATVAGCFCDGDMKSFLIHMNERAKDIGMKNTVFVTSSGLDEKNHHSTAYDMALLTATALKNKTFAEICKMKSAEITVNGKKKTVYNHNKLLSMDKSSIGVKTGYTDKAGRCLVSAEKYHNRTIICVTLSAPDDWNDHLALYKSTKKKYNSCKCKNKFNIKVVGGDKESIKASYKYSIFILNESVYTDEYYYPFLYAPIKKGDIVGYVIINGKKMPIKADEDVKIYG